MSAAVIDLGRPTGARLASPAPRRPDRAGPGSWTLDRLVDLETVVVDVRDTARRTPRLDPVLTGRLAGRAVLFRTGWDGRWGTDAYWGPGPYLGPVLLDQLVHARPAVVGTDCGDVDERRDLARPARSRLLGAGIPILAHLTRLGDVGDRGRTFVVPLAVHRAPSLPVRVFAITTERSSP
jgi:arylformamidase